MELDILFLSVLKYKDKQTGEEKCRFAYLLNDSKARVENANLKGLNELCFYTDSTKPFDILKGEDALKPMVLKVEQKPSKNNPLKTVNEVVEIRTKNETISLL